MMKLSSLLAVVAAILFATGLATVAMAQTTPPPPYAGLKNKFPWSDTSAQRSGKEIYQRSCLGCHGATGGQIAQTNFSTADYSRSLQAKPDLYFWLLSEGRLSRGMPPFKSSLSEEQRWQALTYVWSLGQAAANPPPAKPAAAEKTATLLLTAPEKALGGQPMTLSAMFYDSGGKPVDGAAVKFFVKADFFVGGLLEIGEGLTNNKGVALVEYTPRRTGEIEIIARHEASETTAKLTVTAADEHFYRTDIGLHVPALGKDTSLGPEIHFELGKGGEAPAKVFTLPTGSLYWLTPLLFTVITIWFVYFYVMFQVFRIPTVTGISAADTRRVPLIGLVIVVTLGTLLVLMLVTYPHSHVHLVPSP